MRSGLQYLVCRSRKLRKTGKLLLAVALGKDVIKDKWLIDSARQGRLLPPTSYLAEDPDRETEWGVKLEDSVARGKLGVKPFAGWTIYFTPTLKKELGRLSRAQRVSFACWRKRSTSQNPKGS
jgi:hypothetical protein